MPPRIVHKSCSDMPSFNVMCYLCGSSFVSCSVHGCFVRPMQLLSSQAQTAQFAWATASWQHGMCKGRALVQAALSAAI